MVFRKLSKLEKEVFELIKNGTNSASLIISKMNESRKKKKISKTPVYAAISSLCARGMIEQDGLSEHPKFYRPVIKDEEEDIGHDRPVHLPGECRVHFTGTIVYTVVAEGDLERIADSRGFTIGGWRPYKPGMKGVEDRWGYVRISGQDNKIKYRKSLKTDLRTMSIYPKEIWREIPRGTTDAQAEQWFIDKAELIAKLLSFNGWQLKGPRISGDVKPGKGVHYAYPGHPLTELKGKINHMDSDRTVDIDSSPGDSAELEGYNAEDGYLLGHLPEEFRRVEGIATASMENVEALRKRVTILEGVLDKLISCEEKVAYIETRRLERETNEIAGKYEPKIFRQEGYN